MVSGGTLNYNNILGREDPVSVGTGSIKLKSITDPPDDLTDFLDGMHTLFDARKSFDIGFDAVTNLIEVDSVTGFQRYIGPTGAETKVLNASGTLVATTSQGDLNNETGETLSPSRFETAYCVIETDALGLTTDGFPGEETTITMTLDGKFDRVLGPTRGSGASLFGTAALTDARVYATEIGLNMDDGITVRWVDALGAGQHGLFMAYIIDTAAYIAARGVWITVVQNPDDFTPAEIQTAFNAVTAQLNVFYNNFVTLDFVVRVANAPVDLYIVDKQA